MSTQSELLSLLAELGFPVNPEIRAAGSMADVRQYIADCDEAGGEDGGHEQADAGPGRRVPPPPAHAGGTA